MAALAFSGLLVVLATYIGALLLLTQHIAEQYTPLLVRVVQRHLARLPLVVLSFLIVATGALALVERPAFSLQVLALVLLLAGYVLVLVVCYLMWPLTSDGAKLVEWAAQDSAKTKLPLEDVLEDLLWTAINRADRRVTTAALRVALASSDVCQLHVWGWLHDHRDLLATDWLTRELVAQLLPLPVPPATSAGRVPTGTSDVIDARITLLTAILDAGLDAEAFVRVEDALRRIFTSVAEGNPWTESHAWLLERVGNALWNVGEGYGAIPRHAKLAGKLEDIQAIFPGQLRDVFDHLLKLGDAEAVERYAFMLGRFTSSVPTRDGCESILSRVYDWMEDGFTHGLITQAACSQLACDLGHARKVALDDESLQDFIDHLCVTLAAMLAELGGDEGAISRLLGNAYLFRRGSKLKRDSQHTWLRAESYAVVAQLLHRQPFPRDPRPRSFVVPQAPETGTTLIEIVEGDEE